MAVNSGYWLFWAVRWVMVWTLFGMACHIDNNIKVQYSVLKD